MLQLRSAYIRAATNREHVLINTDKKFAVFFKTCFTKYAKYRFSKKFDDGKHWFRFHSHPMSFLKNGHFLKTNIPVFATSPNDVVNLALPSVQLLATTRIVSTRKCYICCFLIKLWLLSHVLLIFRYGNPAVKAIVLNTINWSVSSWCLLNSKQ